MIRLAKPCVRDEEISEIASVFETGFLTHRTKVLELGVTLGRFSDIGKGGIILAGVTVGEVTQVGAGAVVTESTPRYSVVVGVPARVIKLR